MTVAFIVHIETEDVLAAPQVAEDIDEALSSQGFEVVSVAPWARPSAGIAPAQSLSPLRQQAGPLSSPTTPGLTTP